jgi:RNA polymerase sigma-70 factor (ECF subfamily)
MRLRAEEKFRVVFDAHFEAINRYCLRRIPVSDVNDVVAEVFAVAWRKIDQLPDGGDALPWLYGVARGEVSNRRRSRRRFLALSRKLTGLGDVPDPGPEEILVRGAELEELMTALQTLRPADQELLLLRTHEELSYEQIAIAVGCTPEAARKRLGRAVDRLREAARSPRNRWSRTAAGRPGGGVGR